MGLTILEPSLVEALVEAVSSHENDQHYQVTSGGPSSQCVGVGWLWWNVQKSAAGKRKLPGAELVLELVNSWVTC